MFSTNNKISLRQLQILLILDIFGLSITFLPRRAAELAGQDGWLLIIIGTVIACFCVWIMTTLAGSFPSDSFVDYTVKIAGYPLGILISSGLVIKIIINLSLELRIFAEIIKQIMLFSTPYWVICICMLLLGAYAASKGYEARGRMAEVLIFVIFIPLAFVLCIAVTDVDFSNLKPFFNTPASSLVKGGIYSAFSFSAVEFLLLSYPYLADTKFAQKRSIQATILSGVIVAAITAITIARFGRLDVVRQMWPVLEIMDAIDLPGSFIERQDALIMSFWIIAIFVIINAGMFFSSLILKDIVKKGKHSLFILICIPIVLLISFVPENIVQAYRMIDLSYITFGAAYQLIIPILLLAAARMRGLLK